MEKNERYFDFENEYGPGAKMPEKLLSDGGYCAIFRRIACVGDSLSSGEFESFNEAGEKEYRDYYEYSWGQYLARTCGNTVYNLSRGGMTAKEYCESFAEQKGFWDAQYVAQAYIIALGVNDLYNNRAVVSGEEAIGTVEETDPKNWKNNPKNFAGYYSTIISRYQQIQPRAKFFLVTFPREELDSRHLELAQAHRKLLYDFADRDPNIEVVDLWQYAPIYDAAFKSVFFMGGHMTPMGYVFTAKMIATCIDHLIRKDPLSYAEAAFIGKKHHYYKPKDN